MTSITKVKCGTCRACCKGNPAPLTPEEVASNFYETKDTEKWGIILAKKPNGDCVYLTESGCGIYGYHPTNCMKYNCVFDFVNVSKMSPEKKERILDWGSMTEEMFAAGKERYETHPTNTV